MIKDQDELPPEEEAIPQPSLKKIEANRQNALRSTGPRTRRGKEAVRWNALKHGLLAKEVVIREGDGKEQWSEFRNLLIHLRCDLQPKGTLEEMLVERIAVGYWRLRRVLCAEVGEIQKDLDEAENNYHRQMIRKAVFASVSNSAILRSSLRDNSAGYQFLRETIRKVRKEVEALGRLTPAAYGELVKYFGDQEGSVVNRCLSVAPSTDSSLDDEKSENAAEMTPTQKQLILNILDEEDENLLRMYCTFEKKESFELESHLAALNLPPQRSC